MNIKFHYFVNYFLNKGLNSFQSNSSNVNNTEMTQFSNQSLIQAETNQQLNHFQNSSCSTNHYEPSCTNDSGISGILCLKIIIIL